MYSANAVIVLTSVGILLIGIVFAIRITKILRSYNLARPWMILTSLISLFLLGYIFIALRFSGYNLVEWLTLEIVVTVIFFFGAVFVMILTILNYNLMVEIFGVWMSDAKSVKMFAEFIGLPKDQIKTLIKSEYTVTCDNCEKPVKYSIPSIVRAHPLLKRGVEIDKGMGIISYRLYVRHYCGKDLREIPVSHDSKLEYRSQSPSRPV